MFGTLCNLLVYFVFLASKEDGNFFFFSSLKQRGSGIRGHLYLAPPHRSTPLACKVQSLADGVQSLHAVREFAVSLQAHGSHAKARNCHDQSGYLPGQMESKTYFIRFEDRLDS